MVKFKLIKDYITSKGGIIENISRNNIRGRVNNQNFFVHTNTSPLHRKVTSYAIGVGDDKYDCKSQHEVLKYIKQYE